MQMRLHNITLNLKKCIFGKSEVKFIGHVVGSGKIQMNPERIESLINLKPQKRRNKLSNYLDFWLLQTIYQRFCRDCETSI